MNIEQLVSAHLERLIADPKGWLQLLADDAVVEFPYASSIIRATSRLQGRAVIREYFAKALELFDGLTLSQPTIHLTRDPEVAVVEVHGSTIIKSTGKPYEQDYVMFIKSRAGRIVLYREYWNPLVAVSACDMEVKS